VKRDSLVTRAAKEWNKIPVNIKYRYLQVAGSFKIGAPEDEGSPSEISTRHTTRH
jgi:hypothetical protein